MVNLARTALSCAFGLILATPGCRRAANEEEVFCSKLEAVQRTSSNDRAAIPVRDLTSFEWDQLFGLPPYTTKARARELLGTDVPRELAATSIESRDDINVLVFVKDGSVVRVYSVPRARVELHLDAGAGPLHRNAASFSKRQGSVGLAPHSKVRDRVGPPPEPVAKAAAPAPRKQTRLAGQPRCASTSTSGDTDRGIHRSSGR